VGTATDREHLSFLFNKLLHVLSPVGSIALRCGRDVDGSPARGLLTRGTPKGAVAAPFDALVYCDEPGNAGLTIPRARPEDHRAPTSAVGCITVITVYAPILRPISVPTRVEKR
jgi:hypothetical protein